jgi:hypothetical protein
MKSIKLRLVDYVIKGISDLSLWGGGKGCIEMKPFHVKSLKEIKENLNDNGFGVEKINGAICDIYRNYEGTLRYARTLKIGDISDNTLECFYSA